jgi:ABC-type multidrug transport system fused ATPase/permease subunit
MVADQVINKNTGNLYNVGEVIVIFFTLYLSNLSLSGLPDSIASFSVSRYSMKKILAIVSRVPRVKDGHIDMPDKIDSIVFKNVSFSYDRPLFENLTLKL